MTLSNDSRANWLHTTFRKVLWDFDIPPSVQGIGEAFDPKGFVASLQKARVQAVSMFAKDVFGNCYFKSRILPMHPGLKRDLLKDITEACHHGGIRVLHYYVAFDDHIGRLHPDWCVVSQPGTKVFDGRTPPNKPATSPAKVLAFDPSALSRAICLNSPYAEEVMIPQVLELARHYRPDGFFFDMIAQGVYRPCYCHFCRQRFQKAFGKTPPPGREDPGWVDYLEWCGHGVDQLQHTITEAIRKVNPDTAVVYNAAYVAMLRPLPPSGDADLLVLDVGEGEPPGLNFSFEAKYLVTLKKPFAVMNTRFLHWWGDWMVKPVATLQHECATILANGGRCFLGDKLYPDGTLDQEAFRAIGEAFSFVAQRESFCEGAEAIADIAVLHSYSTHIRRLAAKDPSHTATSSVRGAHKILVENGMPFVMINEQTLLDESDRYRLILLPEQAYVSQRVLDQLMRFVTEGGCVIASHEAAVYDEKGRPRNSAESGDWFGIKAGERLSHSHAYIKATSDLLRRQVTDSPILTHGSFCACHLAGGEILATVVAPLWAGPPGLQGPPGEDTQIPAIVVNRRGKGTVVWMNGEVFSAYFRKNNPQLKGLVRGLIDLVLPERILHVQAPPCVETTLFRQRERWIVHLVNCHAEKATHGPWYAEVIPPIRNIPVRVRFAGTPQSVTQEPDKHPLPFRTRGGYVEFVVPELAIHTMAVIAGKLDLFPSRGGHVVSVPVAGYGS